MTLDVETGLVEHAFDDLADLGIAAVRLAAQEMIISGEAGTAFIVAYLKLRSEGLTSIDDVRVALAFALRVSDRLLLSSAGWTVSSLSDANCFSVEDGCGPLGFIATAIGMSATTPNGWASISAR